MRVDGGEVRAFQKQGDQQEAPGDSLERHGCGLNGNTGRGRRERLERLFNGRFDRILRLNV